MTSRERVLLTINHKEPDRIPISPPNLIPMDEPFDERVKEFLNSFPFDRFIRLNFIKTPSERHQLSEGLFEDGYGCRFEYKGVGDAYCIHHPLAHAQTVEDIEKFPWPDPDEPGLLEEDAVEKAKKISREGKYATVVGIEPIFHRYQWLRGFDQWLIDLKLHPEIHKFIVEKIYHINLTLTLRLLEKVGNYTDIIALGDDLGTSTAPFVSPSDFKIHIKPYFKNLIRQIKKEFPHIKFYLHSHGQIMDLVPDLIDCGVDILNPILPLDNMDPLKLKKDFGDKLCFEGGVDIEHILPFGSVDEVREHVKKIIDILAPGGGFIFKLQAISPLISYENLSTAYKIALEYGRYKKHKGGG